MVETHKRKIKIQ